MSSKGILSGLGADTGRKILKNESTEEVKNLGSEELNIKRSYSLRPSTVKKLQELKVFVYTDPSITYNEIVDEAIQLLYKNKRG
jgi:hypothetical protein